MHFVGITIVLYISFFLSIFSLALPPPDFLLNEPDGAEYKFDDLHTVFKHKSKVKHNVRSVLLVELRYVQGGSNMTGTNAA